MLIASAVVKTVSGSEEIVKSALSLMGGVEVVGQKQGNVIIVLEAETSYHLESISSNVAELKQVYGVYPVYINAEGQTSAKSSACEQSEKIIKS